MHRHLLKAADMLFIIIAKTQTFVFILMVSCFCGRSSTLSVAWDESVWHRASSSNITSDASSKDSRLRWNRIGWSDSCQIWGKLLTRLRCVTTTIDISGIERSSRLKMLWYMTRSLAPDLRNHQKFPQKLCTQSRFAQGFLIGMVYFGWYRVNPHIQTVQNIYGITISLFVFELEAEE